MTEAAPQTEELENVELEEAGAEEGDTFQIIVAIMIAVVSVIGVVMVWQVNLVGGPAEKQAGLRAILNTETTRFINQAELYKNYRAYTLYTLNDQLQGQIAADLADTPPEPMLKHQQAQAADLVAVSQRFFPQRYLNRDGSYNIQRQLGEAWAQARQSTDLEPQVHFDKASKARSKISSIMVMLLGLTIALLFYTIAESLHPARKFLRYVIALTGTLFLLASVAGSIATEMF